MCRFSALLSFESSWLRISSFTWRSPKALISGGYQCVPRMSGKGSGMRKLLSSPCQPPPGLLPLPLEDDHVLWLEMAMPLSAPAPCLIKAQFWCMQSLGDSPSGLICWVGSNLPVSFSGQTLFLSNLGLLKSLLLTDSRCWEMEQTCLFFEQYASMRFPLLMLFLFFSES